jgi:hypothetical protein
MVGQKKVFPNPYTVAATSIITPADCDNIYKPIAAIPEQMASNPRGEILCTIGPAKNRNTNMMADV